jgi:chromosome partitioning protein
VDTLAPSLVNQPEVGCDNNKLARPQEFNMARVICIANQKGGVGKTTTSVNLSSALAHRGNRVLLVDLDPQGNASSGLGLKKHEYQDANIYHVLIGESDIKSVIRTTSHPKLMIAPANPDLVGAEIELVDASRREYRLKDALVDVSSSFDYILIDCPPSLGLLTLNALAAANSFMVPLQCEYYALEGLSQLLNTAGLVKKSVNPDLRIEGIVLTMFDTRNNLSHQVVSEIKTHFGDKVFQAVIPRNVRLSEAPSHGKSILDYDVRSIGAVKYQELAEELEEKVRGYQLADAANREQENSMSPEAVSEDVGENLNNDQDLSNPRDREGFSSEVERGLDV